MLRRTKNGDQQNHQKSDTSFYWQHYGLIRDPFSTIPESDIYFSKPQSEHTLDLLQYRIKNENVLLSVIGEDGIGRTTLVHRFCDQIDKTTHIYAIEADSLFTTRKLIREISKGFELSTNPSYSPEEQLDAQITEIQHHEKPCLFIIDDAHYLPVDTLNALLFLLQQQSTNQMRLHIVLFGDKNLQSKLVHLEQQEVLGEIIQMIELEPFTLEETEHYLASRLQKAGMIDEDILSLLDIGQIHKEAKGIPGRINITAQQALLDASHKKGTAKAKFQSVLHQHKTKIVGGALLVFVLVVVSFILDGHVTIKIQQPNPSFSDKTQSLPKLQNSEYGQANKDQATQNAVYSQLAKTATKQEIVSVKKAPEVSPAIVAVKTSPVEKQVISSSKVNNKTVKQGAFSPKVIQTVIQPVARQVKILSKGNKIHKHIVKNTRAKPSKTNHFSKMENKLLKINGNSYTLQLIGLRHESDIKQFVVKNHLTGKANYFKAILGGKPWYVLIYGKYANKQAANEARKTLSVSLRKYSPWPRSYADVKADIRKAKT